MRQLSFAKIENAPLAEHIADVHRLNLEITEVQILHSGSQQERVERVETIFGQDLSLNTVENRPMLGSQVVTMMQTTEFGE
jgi:hypothetical protein